MTTMFLDDALCCLVDNMTEWLRLLFHLKRVLLQWPFCLVMSQAFGRCPGAQNNLIYPFLRKCSDIIHSERRKRWRKGNDEVDSESHGGKIKENWNIVQKNVMRMSLRIL